VPSRRGAHLTDTRLVLLLAALASTAAAVVHVAAAPAHWSEWPIGGVFFLLMAAFQIGWAVMILAFANRFFVFAGIAVNLGFIGLWALSRWQGVPFGPHAGMPEAVGFADVLTSLLEAWIAVSLAWTLLPRMSHGVLSVGGYRLAAVFMAVALGIAVIPGVGSALAHGEGGHTHGETEEEGDGHTHGTESEMPTSDPTEGGEAPASEDSTEEEAPAEDHTHAPGEEHD
jgi:hypothetical protein